MPMTARVLAKTADQSLTPALAGHGFTRAPRMGGGAWVRPQGDELLLVYFHSSTANGPGAPGSRFTVEIAIGTEMARFRGRRSQRAWWLLTAAERETVRRMENAVKAKLPPPDPAIIGPLDAPDVQPYLEHWCPRADPYPLNVDVWFRYWDEADVHELMTFLGDVLPRVTDRFLEIIALPRDAQEAWYRDLWTETAIRRPS